MTVTLHDAAFDHAQRRIKNGECTLDDREAWTEHQPSADQENRFVEAPLHGMLDALT